MDRQLYQQDSYIMGYDLQLDSERSFRKYHDKGLHILIYGKPYLKDIHYSRYIPVCNQVAHLCTQVNIHTMLSLHFLCRRC